MTLWRAIAHLVLVQQWGRGASLRLLEERLVHLLLEYIILKFGFLCAGLDNFTMLEDLVDILLDLDGSLANWIVQELERAIRLLQLFDHLLVACNVALQLSLNFSEVVCLLLTIVLLFTKLDQLIQGSIPRPMQIILEEVLVHALNIADIHRWVLAPLRGRWLCRCFEEALIDEWLSRCIRRILALRRLLELKIWRFVLPRSLHL